MNLQEISDRLVRKGRILFESPREFWPFTGLQQADELINDLDRTPHAYVIGCIGDRQIQAEKAWAIPYELSRRLGSFLISDLCRLSEQDMFELMITPAPLHRFNKEVSNAFVIGIKRIVDTYDGDASRIWAKRPRCAEVERRFLEFHGVGPKIASMATNGLVRHFKVPMSDYSGIQISADVQVRRVFARSGLCPSPATIQDCIGVAQEICPEFPGLLDFPTWEIGRTWCHTTQPNCRECYLTDVCEKNISHNEPARAPKSSKLVGAAGRKPVRYTPRREQEKTMVRPPLKDALHATDHRTGLVLGEKNLPSKDCAKLQVMIDASIVYPEPVPPSVQLNKREAAVREMLKFDWLIELEPPQAAKDSSVRDWARDIFFMRDNGASQEVDHWVKLYGQPIAEQAPCRRRPR